MLTTDDADVKSILIFFSQALMGTGFARHRAPALRSQKRNRSVKRAGDYCVTGPLLFGYFATYKRYGSGWFTLSESGSTSFLLSAAMFVTETFGERSFFAAMSEPALKLNVIFETFLPQKPISTVEADLNLKHFDFSFLPSAVSVSFFAS